MPRHVTPVTPSSGPSELPTSIVDHRKRLEEHRDQLEAAIADAAGPLATLDERKLLAPLSARYQAVLTELAALPEVKTGDVLDELAARRPVRRPAP